MKTRQEIEKELIEIYTGLGESMRRLMFIQLVERSSAETLEAIQRTNNEGV